MNKILTCIGVLLFAVVFVQAQTISVEAKQVSIASKKTATWCPICGQTAWDTFLDIVQERGEEVIPLALHYDRSSSLYSETADEMIKVFERSPGQPVFYFNATKLSGRGASVVTDIRERAVAVFDDMPVAQSGILARFNADDNKLTITTRTEFFQDTEGTYTIGFYPILKEMVARQAARSNNSVHKQIMADELTGKHFGIALAEGSIAAGTSVDKMLELSFFDYAEDVMNDNLELMTIIWKETADGQEFVNAFMTDDFSGMASSVTELAATTAALQVLPTADRAVQIQLQAKTQLQQATLEVFDLAGKLVTRLAAQDFAAGHYSFDFSAAQSGMYLLNLRANGKQLTQKFVVQ